MAQFSSYLCEFDNPVSKDIGKFNDKDKRKI